LSDTKRISELDGLRGLAALSVYFSHLIGIFNTNSKIFEIISNSPIHILWDGESAVRLFFLLSGFVLTFPFIKNKDKMNLFSFYKKRIFRIYPVFIVSIIVCIFFKTFLFDPFRMLGFSPWINTFWKWNYIGISYKELLNTFILVGSPFNTDLFDPVIGTLRKEMIISFIFPFFIWIALRVKMVINLIILITFFHLGNTVSGIFYLGIIMALNQNLIIEFIDKKDNYFISFVIFILASFFYSIRYSLSFLISDYESIFSLIGCMFFLFLAMKNGLFKTFLNSKFIMFLGKISYSFYLFHFPILLVVSSFFSNNFYLILPISLFFSFLMGYLGYLFIEIPFIAIGEKINLNKFDFLLNKIFCSFSNYANKSILARLIKYKK
jgi:peptidoglycan/LPS O-acetylase OafA/YrhL